MNTKKVLSANGFVLAIASLTLPAVAQEDENKESEDNTVLEVINVTAERRTENLQEVPVAVSAFSEEMIERQQIESTLDVINSVPNLSGSQNVGISSATSFFMRGVGQDESISTQDPAIGTYIDGVYVSRQVANNAFLYDIERIEVLRGPQGILYGRNTSGGAIKIVTRDPYDSFDGTVEVEAGNYDFLALRGKVNIPISDNIFLGLSAYTQERDEGFLNNVTLGNTQWNEDSSGFRGTLKYEVSDNFDIVVSAEFGEQSDNGITGTNALGNLADDLFTVESGLDDSESAIEQTALTTTMTWRGENSTWTSITGYRDLKQDLRVDFSDSPVPGFVIDQRGDFSQFSQEFQGSGDIGKFSWILGTFYMTEDNQNIRRDELFLFGGVVAANFVADLDNDSENFAVFGQGTYELTDKLSLKLGGRWTREEKSVDIVQSVDVGGGVLAPLFDNNTLQELGTETNPTFTEFTPSFGLNYKVDDDTLAYFSYSSGFKSGGWNARATDPLDFNLIAPEFVDAFEVGYKTEFLDNSVRLNTAVFYNEYEDFVVTALNPLTGGFVTINAAEVIISGIEMELTAAITEDFELFGNFGYLHNEYDELGENVVFNIDNDVKRTPPVNAQIGFNYYIGLDDADVVLHANYTYQDEYFAGPANADVELAEAQKLLNASASYEFGGGKYTLTLACKNCTDQEYFHSVLDFSALGFATQFPGAPRTYTLTGRIAF